LVAANIEEKSSLTLLDALVAANIEEKSSL